MSRFVPFILLLTLATLPWVGCDSAGPGDDGGNGGPTGEVELSTDKAAYRPGETVMIQMDGDAPAGARVRYKYLGAVVEEAPVTGSSWQWTPPADDFRGYMVELYREESDADVVLATVAVDVSSDWTRFPRYGFLSHYGELSDSQIDAVLDNLNRHHINGIQFYDWHHKHHLPLPGTASQPQAEWVNIFGEKVRLSTVQRYVDGAHDRGMAAMFYNLIFGALEDAAIDGVGAGWYLYTDAGATNRDRHQLPQPPFTSDIFLVDPSNQEWVDYLIGENEKVYGAIDFDGFHMDQLGDRGTRYRQDGSVVNLSATYGQFVEAMAAAHPEKDHVLNAVNQYGQANIAASPVDFLYTEVWPPNNSYADLARILSQNADLTNGAKNSVLAAYVNYGRADNPGVFNTPSVLFANAVIFAFGGSHLELGEHMLGKEFFPNDNLLMRQDLVDALVDYYDFLVAYQNLLRDGGAINQPVVQSSSLEVTAWPPSRGAVSVVGREVGSSQVIHLLNFTDATTMSWRDDEGVQAYPFDRVAVPLTISVDGTVERIWYATPDREGGASKDLAFSQSGNSVSVHLPYLKYWSMIVVEYA